MFVRDWHVLCVVSWHHVVIALTVNQGRMTADKEATEQLEFSLVPDSLCVSNHIIIGTDDAESVGYLTTFGFWGMAKQAEARLLIDNVYGSSDFGVKVMNVKATDGWVGSGSLLLV